jgi:hypothetical protein
MLAASRHELRPSSKLIELLICLFAGWIEQGQPVNQCNQTLIGFDLVVASSRQSSWLAFLQLTDFVDLVRSKIA